MAAATGSFLAVMLAAAILTVAAGPVRAAARRDTNTQSLAPWNAPDPFCRKNCIPPKACPSTLGSHEQQKSANSAKGSGRWRR